MNWPNTYMYSLFNCFLMGLFGSNHLWKETNHNTNFRETKKVPIIVLYCKKTLLFYSFLPECPTGIQSLVTDSGQRATWSSTVALVLLSMRLPVVQVSVSYSACSIMTWFLDCHMSLRKVRTWLWCVSQFSATL